jgi:hypothetical protein
MAVTPDHRLLAASAHYWPLLLATTRFAIADYRSLPLQNSSASELTMSKSKLCYDRRSVGQFISVSSAHLGPKTRFLLLPDNCGFVDTGRPL